MASPAITRNIVRQAQTPSAPLAAALAGIALLSLPVAGLAFSLNDAAFLSSQHARILATALVATDQGSVEQAIFSYPPGPTVIALVAPSAFALSLMAALTCGALMWLLWHELAQTKLQVVVRMCLIVATVVAPGLAFLATQDVGTMMALLLFVSAWRYFFAFVHTRQTWYSFAAGLALGAGFFFSIYAVAYAVLIAAASCFFYEHVPGQTRQERIQMIMTGMIVIAFPTLMAFVTWSYINWIFSGDPFGYLATDVTTPGGQADNLALTLLEIARKPLYLMVGLLTILYTRRQIVAFLIPVALIFAARFTGSDYAHALALSTFAVVAILALPRALPQGWSIVLVLVAGLQLLIGLVYPPAIPEINQWAQAVVADGMLPDDAIEIGVSQQLAAAPTNSIAVNGDASRLIARMGTAAPLVLPGEPLYTSVVTASQVFAPYLLTDQTAGNDRYPDMAPDARWRGWTIYKQAGAASLFYP